MALGPTLGEHDLVLAETERGRPAGEHAVFDLELGRQDVLDPDAAGDRTRRVLGRPGRQDDQVAGPAVTRDGGQRGGGDLGRDVLAVPDVALRDHLGLGVAAHGLDQLGEHRVHVEEGELVEGLPVDRLRDHPRRELAALVEEPHPAHAGLDAQEGVVHVEERCAHAVILWLWLWR